MTPWLKLQAYKLGAAFFRENPGLSIDDTNEYLEAWMSGYRSSGFVNGSFYVRLSDTCIRMNNDCRYFCDCLKCKQTILAVKELNLDEGCRHCNPVKFLELNPVPVWVPPERKPQKIKFDGPTPPREAPREIKPVTLVHNPELDGIILGLISAEPAWVDYQAGKEQAVGRLVGLVKKQLQLDPVEIKARIEAIRNEHSHRT